MGLVKDSWPLIERPADVQAWDVLTDQERDRFDNIMGKEIAKGKIELKAAVNKDSLVLSVNGKEVAKGASGGVLKELPGLGLFIGLDGVHPVGEYEVPNRFKGKVIKHEVKALPNR